MTKFIFSRQPKSVVWSLKTDFKKANFGRITLLKSCLFVAIFLSWLFYYHPLCVYEDVWETECTHWHFSKNNIFMLVAFVFNLVFMAALKEGVSSFFVFQFPHFVFRFATLRFPFSISRFVFFLSFFLSFFLRFIRSVVFSLSLFLFSSSHRRNVTFVIGLE